MANLKDIASKLDVVLEVPTDNVNSEKKLVQKRRAWIEADSFTENTETILKIDPKEIIKWKYKDRPENELGDLEEFSKVLKKIGQLQPGIVRRSTVPGYKYELLVGERRWRACALAGLLFQAKLVDYTDTEAGLAQAAENEGRKKLSDYARGMNYALQIQDGVLKQADLVEKLGTTRQQISKLLSYREIPTELVEAIGDMTKVSPTTAEQLKLICKNDPEGLSILLLIADKIKCGVGHNTIKKHYEKAKLATHEDLSNSKVFSKDGRHLFTWRKDGNGNLSISFPKDIRNILDIKQAESLFIESIEVQIKHSLSLRRDKNGEIMQVKT